MSVKGRKIKYSVACAGVIVAILAMVFSVTQSMQAMAARSLDDAILAKAYYTGLQSCYLGGQMVETISVSDLINVGSMFNGDGGGSGYVKLPNTMTGAKNDSVSCKELFSGKNDFVGLYKIGNMSSPNYYSTDDEKNALLNNMGYVATGDGNKRCVSFKYTLTKTISGVERSPETVLTDKICVMVDNNSNIADKDQMPEVERTTDVDVANKIVMFTPVRGGVRIVCDPKNSLTTVCDYVYLTAESDSWNTFVDDIKGQLQKHRADFTIKTAGSRIDGLEATTSRYVLNPTDPTNETISNTIEYTIKDRVADASKMAAQNILGSIPGLVFSVTEKTALYYTYLRDFYKVETVCSSLNEEQMKNLEAVGYTKVKLYYNGMMNPDCYVRPQENADKNVNGLTDNNKFSQERSFKEIIDALNGSSISVMPADYDWADIVGTFNEDGTISTGGNNTTSGVSNITSGNTDTCDAMVKSSGANIGAMQWILCPTMDNLKYTASWMDDMTEDWLEVSKNLYDGNSNARIVWEHIRNIANVLMIIVLMVVVFSQLTGYGIDNYGIKKMLPRLIVMAIIINLSFYICEIAVDLSNIAGIGLRNLFGSIGNALDKQGELSGQSFIGGMITGLFSAASSATGAVSIGMTVFTLSGSVTVAVIIAAIVLCLIILVAVVTLFLMLGAREIIVVLCIALSPLAFAMFILPNTQNLFKRWWDLFKAALIVYPICGALSGISYMIRATTTGELHVWGFAILMVLPYLGFFLIPVLLKNAISALGKIGGALSTMGQTVRNGGRQLGQTAMQVGQNTDWYKKRQAEANRSRENNAAQRTIDKINRIKNGGGKLTDAQKRQYDEAVKTQQRLKSEQALADLGPIEYGDEEIKERAEAARDIQERKNYTDKYLNMTRGEVAAQLTSAVTDYEGARASGDKSKIKAAGLRLQAALEAAESKGMNKEMLSAMAGLKLSYSKRYDSDTGTDAKILSTLSNSSDISLSQYGKQMSKFDGATDAALSLSEFADGSNKDAVNKEISLYHALKSKGANALIGQNDDSLAFIDKHQANSRTNTNHGIADVGQLVTAAGNTTNQKELTLYNKMIEGSPAADVNLTGKQIGNADESTLDSLIKMAGADDSVRDSLFSATSDLATNTELMNNLSTTKRAKIDGFRKSVNPSDVAFISEEDKRAASDPGYWVGLKVDDVQKDINSGRLTQDMMNKILTSSDPNIQSALAGNAELENTLRAGASGYAGRDWKDKAAVEQAAIQHKGGMDASYVLKGSADVVDEAWADGAEVNARNAEREAQEKAMADERAAVQRERDNLESLARSAEILSGRTPTPPPPNP